MKKPDQKFTNKLTDHFFRKEYGKIVSVITRYMGADNVETAEDIVQETLLKAVQYWQHNGIPENPQAWLYTTAKNLTLNVLKRNKYERKYKTQPGEKEIEDLSFSEQAIADEQLRMMFACCNPSISEKSQIALILKILCGFSISEISNAFFSTTETINKRLVRGRKQFRESKISIENPTIHRQNLNVVLNAIYLLFNEGYNPTQNNDLIRFDLCKEAIRLVEILISHEQVEDKEDCHSLMALMCLNASRFKARIKEGDSIIEMRRQDRVLWEQNLINKGIHHLEMATKQKKISKYLLLACISAHHSIAPTFEETNWEEILSLYDNLLILEDSPIARLNRCVAVSKVKGNSYAINELLELRKSNDVNNNHLLYCTLGELYSMENDTENAINHFNKALLLTKNIRDSDFIRKKIP